MEIIDGNKISKSILEHIRISIGSLKLRPILKIFNVGQNYSSSVYINKKQQRGKDVGIKVDVEQYPGDVNIDIFKEGLIKASEDDSVHGIIVQLPIKDIDLEQIFPLIPVRKDVDGLNPTSLGLLWHDQAKVFIPATVKAILFVLETISQKENAKDLKSYLSGKKVLVINRSFIVGKPLAATLLNNDATVTIAHSKTKDLEGLVQIADIIISATGQAGLLNKFKLKDKVVLVDGGFNNEGGKIKGDIEITPEIKERCSYLSPVPGGIGPIGVACLLENTFISAKDI